MASAVFMGRSFARLQAKLIHLFRSRASSFDLIDGGDAVERSVLRQLGGIDAGAGSGARIVPGPGDSLGAFAGPAFDPADIAGHLSSWDVRRSA